MLTRRYPVVPVIAIILKVMAVLLLLGLIFAGIMGIIQINDAVKQASAFQKVPFGQLVQAYSVPVAMLIAGLAVPAILWGLADLFSAVREIEFFSRRNAEGIIAPAETRVDTTPGNEAV